VVRGAGAGAGGRCGAHRGVEIEVNTSSAATSAASARTRSAPLRFRWQRRASFCGTKGSTPAREAKGGNSERSEASGLIAGAV
jgi:hypothetical protein